jgi:hypothetical protein
MIGGFAREDADVTSIVAVLTDEVQAKKLAKVVFGCTITPMEVDVIPKGWVEHAKAFGLDLSNKG